MMETGKQPLTPRTLALLMSQVPRRSRRALNTLIAVWRMVVAIMLLSILLLCAVYHDIVRRLRMSGGGWKTCMRSLRRAQRDPTNVKSIEQLCAENGFFAESHYVLTEDGYRLQLYRLRKGVNGSSSGSDANGHDRHHSESKTPSHGDTNGFGNTYSTGYTNGIKSDTATSGATYGTTSSSPSPSSSSSVLLQHGLFQTCLPFVYNGDSGSLAFVLANAGHDVWLGNNRGNLHSRRHRVHDAADDDFWDFGVDEHALDVAANAQYVKANNEGRQLVYIGHSQGAAQAFIAFSTKPELQSIVSHFVAMSPGAFVKTLESRPLRLLANLSNRHPRLFYVMFGRGAFLPFMEVMRIWLGIRLFGYFAFCMFNYLMRWGDDYWDKTRKFLYFSQTPGGTSARTVAQWMQQAASGRFFRYNHGSVALNRKYYQSDEPPDVDLSKLHLPVSVIYGGQDLLLDYPKLISRLPNCVYSLNVKHHQHMDNLNAIDAKTTVYPQVLKLLASSLAGTYPSGTSTAPPTIVV